MFKVLHVISWVLMAVLIVYGFYDVTLSMAKASYDKKCRVFRRQITYGFLFMALVSAIETVVNYLANLKLGIPDTSGFGSILNTLAGYHVVLSVLFLIVYRFLLYGFLILVVWIVCRVIVKKHNSVVLETNDDSEEVDSDT